MDEEPENIAADMAEVLKVAGQAAQEAARSKRRRHLLRRGLQPEFGPDQVPETDFIRQYRERIREAQRELNEAANLEIIRGLLAAPAYRRAVEEKGLNDNQYGRNE